MWTICQIEINCVLLLFPIQQIRCFDLTRDAFYPGHAQSSSVYVVALICVKQAVAAEEDEVKDSFKDKNI